MNFDDVHSRLRAFGDLMAVTPKRKERADAVEQLLEHYDGPFGNVVHLFRHEKKQPITTEAMDRWVTVEFPRSVVDLTGMYGTSVRVSDVLRWTVSDGLDDPLLGDYYSILAYDLDAHDVPRPAVSDPTPMQMEALSELMGIIAHISAYPAPWSKQPMLQVDWHARSLLRDLEVGTRYSYCSIDYPVDFGPPNLSTGMMCDTGWMLKRAVERASYFSQEERSQVATAALFYPDDGLAIEVNAIHCSGLIHLTDLSAITDRIPESDMGPAMGSIHVDNYGSTSRFSSDAGEFEFKLHMPAAGTGDEYVDMCFLVSKLVTYTAQIGRDD